MVCKYCTDKKLQDIVNAYLGPEEQAQYCPVCGRNLLIVELIGPIVDMGDINVSKVVARIEKDYYRKAMYHDIC